MQTRIVYSEYLFFFLSSHFFTISARISLVLRSEQYNLPKETKHFDQDEFLQVSVFVLSMLM